MRADRLLSIVLLLQAHRRLTGRDLAARLEVSERTVHRDMEALSAAGVPVYALRGVQGGWQIDEDWRTQVPGLEEAELQALLMAQPVVTGDSRLASAATSALAKLTAAMPAALRERAAAMQQRLYVDNTSWSGYEEDLSALPAVQEAVSRDRKLAIEYRKGTEVVSRVVDPLGLVAKGSVWYLVALSEGASRTYRVSRIARATVLDVPSPRPPDFDLAAHWKASAARYRETRPEYEAILRVTPETARTISMWRQLTRVAGYEAPDDGRLNVRIQFESEEHARFVVLGLGRAADVVEPVELREYVHREAEAIVKRMKCARTTAAKPINESTKARPCPTSQRSR